MDREYVTKVLDSVKLMPTKPESTTTHTYDSWDFSYIKDTVIMGRKISLQQELIAIFQNCDTIGDTLRIVRPRAVVPDGYGYVPKEAVEDTTTYVPFEYFPTADGGLQINTELKEYDSTYKSYYFNSDGLLYKYTQVELAEENGDIAENWITIVGADYHATGNVFTTLYFYNEKGLNIRAEDYMNDKRRARTDFHYHFGSH